MDLLGKKYNWGFVGAGNIVKAFLRGLSVCDNAVKYAIASRSEEKAKQYAEEFGIAKAYGSYDDLAADQNVDIVYIGVTNNAHFDLTMKFLKAGKHVLCEKPMVMDSVSAVLASSYAREKKLFLMEGLWWRFLPVYESVDRWVRNGEIGEIHFVKADFGYRKENLTGRERQLLPEMGGGALYDVGIYNISFANKYLGQVDKISGYAAMGPTGVDMWSTASLRYKNEGLAVLTSSFRTPTPWDAWLVGSKGSIVIRDYWKATKACLCIAGKEEVSVEEPFESNGYEYEARHVMHCLDQGLTESPELPLADTIATSRIIDELLVQYGFGNKNREVK